jgi:anti-sigma factor RsiW
MTPCEYNLWISALVDGELDAQRRATLEAHLPGCPQCQAELESLQQLAQSLRQLAPPPISPEALRRLHAAADELGDRSLRHLAEALSGVAAVILIGCSFWLFRAPSVQASDQLPPWYSISTIRPQQNAVPQSMQTAEWIFSELSSDQPGHD